MQRKSVVLPEPLGPMTTSPEATESEMSRSTSSAPKRLRRPVISRIGRSTRFGATSMAEEDAPLEVSAIKGKGIADAEINRRRADKDLKRCECTLDDLAARHRQLPETDDRHQRGCFDQTDAEADIRRGGKAQRLRQHHDPQYQAAGHAEAARRIPLRLRQ